MADTENMTTNTNPSEIKIHHGRYVNRFYSYKQGNAWVVGHEYGKNVIRGGQIYGHKFDGREDANEWIARLAAACVVGRWFEDTPLGAAVTACSDCGNLSTDPLYGPFEGSLCFPCAEGARLL